MQDASAQTGDHIIGLTASRFGYGLYKQFGFQHLFDYCIYHIPVDG
jgi:hypothetical protein